MRERSLRGRRFSKRWLAALTGVCLLIGLGMLSGCKNPYARRLSPIAAEDNRGRPLGVQLSCDDSLKEADTTAAFLVYLSPGKAGDSIGNEFLLVLQVWNIFPELSPWVDLDQLQLIVDDSVYQFQSAYEPTVATIEMQHEKRDWIWQQPKTSVYQLGEQAEVVYPVDVEVFERLGKARDVKISLTTQLGPMRYSLGYEHKAAFRHFLRHYEDYRVGDSELLHR